MQAKSLEKTDREISAIITALGRLGPMRPGGLSRQYHKPEEREGGYWQLSYTHRRRSYSENVREAELERVKAEVAEYRKFKELCARWVDLGLERSRTLRALGRQTEGESRAARGVK